MSPFVPLVNAIRTELLLSDSALEAKAGSNFFSRSS